MYVRSYTSTLRLIDLIIECMLVFNKEANCAYGCYIGNFDVTDLGTMIEKPLFVIIVDGFFCSFLLQTA